MLSVEIKPSDRFGEKIFGLSTRIRRKWNLKLEETAKELYEKVIQNLSGKILQTKTEDLRDSIHLETFTSGYDFIAFVGPVPATPKAYALEFGGKNDYLIQIGAKGVLANRETGFFSKHSVIHPASKEYAYLRTALAEIEPTLPGEFVATLSEEL